MIIITHNYRMGYHALAVNNLGPETEIHKSMNHHDGKPCFGGGWFVVSCKLKGKLVSNHYKYTKENWNMFNIPEAKVEKWSFDSKKTTPKFI